jgi:toxin ParE1/3/4
MKRLILTAQAVDDLADIHAMIVDASNHVDVADRFIDEIETHCLRIAELPSRIGRPRPEFGHNLRSLPHGNYLIFLRYHDEDTLEIVAVVHAARDLGAYFEDTSDR